MNAFPAQNNEEEPITKEDQKPFSFHWSLEEKVPSANQTFAKGKFACSNFTTQGQMKLILTGS